MTTPGGTGSFSKYCSRHGSTPRKGLDWSWSIGLAAFFWERPFSPRDSVRQRGGEVNEGSKTIPRVSVGPLRFFIFVAVVVECRVDHVEEMLAARGGRVLGRPVRPLAGRQAGEIGVEIGIEKEGQRIAVLARSIDHPMKGRAEDPVGPALHHVADIDDEAAGDIRRVDPLPGAVTHLEPADRILGQDGEAAEIRMGAGTQPALGDGALMGRVMERPQ